MTPRHYLAALTALLAGIGLPAWTQQRMTNIAVVDVAKVQTAYFRDTARSREYTAFVEQFRQELDKRKADLADLQVRRADANRAGSTTEVARLDAQIEDLQVETDTYVKLNEQRRLRLVNELTTGDRFFRDLSAAVQWVCNQEGYALALNLAEITLLWWDPLIDITQKVIERMGVQ